jgi:spore maturation protein CgeB
MKIVVFGLTVSSSWGNGHATLWRGLIRALAALGHRVVFFERDVPYYAMNRDLVALPGGELVLYREIADVEARMRDELGDADVAIVTSYCPDALAATALALASARPLKLFYDLDTPVTLARLREGERVPYLGADGLAGFDLVLSYTGGAALAELERRLGARSAAPLYGHVDPQAHRAVAPVARYRADLSYLGTYAADRQQALEALFVTPAQRRPELRFLIGGAQYPHDFPWSDNIYFVRHLPPEEHPAFFSSSRLTLNLTRHAMAAMGWCPSGRLFEAAACGTAILSDHWEGLDAFFAPGRDIIVARNADDVLAALDLSDAEIARIGAAARERALAEHTSMHRAKTLVGLIENAARIPAARMRQPAEA